MTNWLIVAVIGLVLFDIAVSLGSQEKLRQHGIILARLRAYASDIQLGVYHIWPHIDPQSWIRFRKEKTAQPKPVAVEENTDTTEGK